MAPLASPSPRALRERRQQLRRRRRWRLVQQSWQFLAVAGLAVGLGWVAVSPVWVLRGPNQVRVEGNRLLSEAAVRDLLPLAYPQSLWKLQPRQLARELEARAPIERATAIRQLVPPGLTVQVRELQPVAIAEFEGAPPDQQVGLLDPRGFWIPLDRYRAVQSEMALPDLKVLGDPERYRPHWPAVYRSLAEIAVEIREIDWRDPANIVLRTELGPVHCGSYGPQFPEQMAALQRLGRLPEQVPASQIDYIDLRDPQAPSVLTRP